MTGLLALTAVAATRRPAAAVTWNESGDAADLPATAQATTRCGGLTAISGTKESNAADMFQIRVDDPASFSATTSGLAGFDTQLFLLDAGGFGVYANDDISGSNTRSTLPAGHASGPPAAGVYYLAISQYNKDPQSPAA